MKNRLSYLISTVLFFGALAAQAAVFALEGHWEGHGNAYDPSGKNIFSYEVDENNTAPSFSEIDSQIKMTLEDGTTTELDLTYEDTSLYDCTITSNYGSGEGTCSSMWGPCNSEFGTEGHSFKTTLYVDGMNSGHMVKKEFIEGKLTTIYKESYVRTGY